MRVEFGPLRAIAMLGVIARPWNSPELVWAMAGAAMPVLSGLRSCCAGAKVAAALQIRISNIGNDLDAALARHQDGGSPVPRRIARQFRVGLVATKAAC